jgi:hypothetical protein
VKRPKKAALPQPPAEPPAEPPPLEVSAPERSGLAAEIRALDQARADLAAGHPERTLDALERYWRAFPSGVLGPEAAALEIDAAVASGDDQLARSRATAFVAAHPDHPLAPKVRALLENPGR